MDVLFGSHTSAYVAIRALVAVRPLESAQHMWRMMRVIAGLLERSPCSGNEFVNQFREHGLRGLDGEWFV